MNKKSNTFFATIVSIGSAGLVFLGMVTCCGIPFLAGILATVGVGASQLSFLAKYQGVFMGIAMISLLFGFYQAYFTKKSSCCGDKATKPQSCCGTETEESVVTLTSSRFLQFQKAFLWIGAAIVGAALLFSGNRASTDAPSMEGSPCCPVSNVPTMDTPSCPEGCSNCP